jgi:hypothetical protein
MPIREMARQHRVELQGIGSRREHAELEYLVNERSRVGTRQREATNICFRPFDDSSIKYSFYEHE